MMDLQQYTTDAIRTESVIDAVRVNELLLVSVVQQIILMGGILDQIKKNTFYGDKKPYDMNAIRVAIEMSSENLKTMGTLSEHEVTNEKRQLDVNPRLFHGIVGMITESVEMLEALPLYGGEVDGINLLEEIGDSSWYQAIVIDEIGGSWEDVLRTNLAKLMARFPDKFDDTLAVTRNLDAERAILDTQTHR